MSLLVSLNSRNLWAGSLTSELRSRSRAESQGQIIGSRGLHVHRVDDMKVRRILPNMGSLLNAEPSFVLQSQQIYIDVESHEMVHVDDTKAPRS